MTQICLNLHYIHIDAPHSYHLLSQWHDSQLAVLSIHRHISIVTPSIYKIIVYKCILAHI